MNSDLGRGSALDISNDGGRGVQIHRARLEGLFVTEDDVYDEFGAPPLPPERIAEVRSRLSEALSTSGSSAMPSDALKLLCVYLFFAGEPSDVEFVWKAKTSSADADISVDIQLLIRESVDATMSFLRDEPFAGADAALARIKRSVESGDFEAFGFRDSCEFYKRYYAD